ncbi:tail fiber domain-containing protein [Dyadobacter tibetensis]|uniref:tail fiber domain-containing protein n=1 Tax=Dyadobacter tibetensis TaxID=1211851 RepID=UPI000472ECD7|nr:tail fiber domain-containing protein [Dyadobacter tibetensis]
MKANLFARRFLITATFVGATFVSFAQVKIGSNPTVIGTNTNLEVEATNSSPFVVKKSNGYVGVNTMTPANLVHVSGLENQGLLIDVADASSSIYASANGGITVKRVGASKTIAPHVGGYLDLIGLAESNGWRLSQYGNFFGLCPQGSSDINAFPFYVHNGGRISMGTAGQLGVAKLSVYGQIAGYGYSTRNGTNGASQNNSFNVSWDGSNARLWIDAVNLGVLETTSDYRLKKNVANMSNSATTRVNQLRPVSFEYKDVEGDIFKSDHNVHEGFIAHELQAIVPSAVSGEKDALTAEGKIQPQTLKAFPIISLLTKAVQEQDDRIEALEAENASLKSQLSKMEAITARLTEIEAKLAVSENSGSMLTAQK